MNSTKLSFKYWSTKALSQQINVPVNAINNDQAFVNFCTSFQVNAPIWTPAGGLQLVSGNNVKPEDDLAKDFQNMQYVLVRGGELQCNVLILEEPSTTTSNTGNLINAVSKDAMICDVWLAFIKPGGAMLNKPNGVVPAMWHPAMVYGIHTSFWLARKSRRFSLVRGTQKRLVYKFRASAFLQAQWASQKGFPCFIVKVWPGSTPDTNGVVVNIEVGHRLCMVPLNQRVPGF